MQDLATEGVDARGCWLWSHRAEAPGSSWRSLAGASALTSCETIMTRFITKNLWDKTVCAALLGLALAAGIAAGMRVAIILDRL
jgi:hypothetical protein